MVSALLQHIEDTNKFVVLKVAEKFKPAPPLDSKPSNSMPQSNNGGGNGVVNGGNNLRGAMRNICGLQVISLLYL